MKDYLVEKKIRLRFKKNYAEAHTHIIIGTVIEECSRYLAVKGRTFHFKRLVDKMKNQVHCGETTIRIIPWDNIELIHLISDRANWDADIDFAANGNLVLRDAVKTVIATNRDSIVS